MSMSTKNKDQQTADKAKRDLDRVSAESDTLGTSAMARMAKKTSDRFSAADVDQDDKIEVWGTRIGRGAGLIFAIFLAIYLFYTYVLN